MAVTNKDGKQSWSAVPRGVWALGFVSMFMDISSEMIHSLLPVFLITVIGTSATVVGVIEGIGEATGSISKLFSGWLSDRLGRRKLLTVIGYGLGAASKPLFALATTATWVFVARFSDRIGKGVRGAPRDALVADISPPHLRGASYGLRQSLDTIGAFSGPLLAIALMALLDNDFRLVFWIALIPGLISVAILIVVVREPETLIRAEEARPPIRWADIRRLGNGFYGVVVVGTVLTLARFSEAFLVLRAQALGLPLALVPLVLVVMNVVYALSAYPMGVLSDRVDRKRMLMAGFGVLILADLVLAAAPNIWLVMLGVGLWGLHMGMTQGLLATLVADAAPSVLRGTAFGVFNLVSGVALLIASVVAGGLWELVGAPATFLAGAAFSLVGVIGAGWIMTRRASEDPLNP